MPAVLPRAVGYRHHGVRAVGNTRAWVTNEYEHDGNAISQGKVLARLMDMTAGRV